MGGRDEYWEAVGPEETEIARSYETVTDADGPAIGWWCLGTCQNMSGGIEYLCF